MELKTGQERVIAGIVGAFLGSLIGVAFIVILGQLGYVASISGLVMAVCAMKGYELFGGWLSKKGAIASAVLIIVMTYVGHRLDWAVSAARFYEIGIVEAFRAIDYLLNVGAIEAGSFWGGLVMLYLFNMIGAFSTIRHGLHGYGGPMPYQGMAAGEADMEAGKAAWEDQPEFYHEEKGWMRPLRTSLRLSLLPGFFIIFGSLIVFGRVAGSDGSRVIVMTMLFGMIGAYLATIIAMCAVISSIRLSRSDGWLFVRWRGILWRVDLNRLNRMRPYQFTRKTGALLALAWSRLNPEEQEQAKASAFRAIRDMSGGQVTGSIAVRAVLPLTDLRLIKENQWGWRVSYLAANGRKQQVTIAKAYSGLRPVPETEPARGPVPRRWGLVAVMLLLAVLLATLGGIVGYGAAGGFDTVRRPKAAEARIPDNTTAYEQYGVSYLVDSTFRNQGDGLFYDPETNASYSVSVWFDVDEEDAVDRLLQPISDYRMDENFDSFRFEHAGAETTLVPLTAADGSIFQYEILSVYFKDGQTLHTGAALSENGILVLVEVSHEDKRDEDEVKGSLLFILESVEIGEVS